MAGTPHLTHLRSVSLFGLSSVMLIFDDDSINDWNRQKVLERLSQVTLPNGLQPQMGTDWSPVGQILLVHAEEHEPEYDLMELKSIEIDSPKSNSSLFPTTCRGPDAPILAVMPPKLTTSRRWNRLELLFESPILEDFNSIRSYFGFVLFSVYQ